MKRFILVNFLVILLAACGGNENIFVGEYTANLSTGVGMDVDIKEDGTLHMENALYSSTLKYEVNTDQKELTLIDEVKDEKSVYKYKETDNGFELENVNDEEQYLILYRK